jgi:oligopeptide transport system substrate-binding protein
MLRRQMLSGRKIWAFIGLVVLLGACGQAPEDRVSHLRRDLGGIPDSFDIHKAQSTQAHWVQYDLYQGLLEYSASGQLQSGVAESWSVSEDGLSYRFLLRPGAQWSNGDPVVAEDFAASFRRLVEPETGAFYADFVAMIANAPEILKGEKAPETLGVVAKSANELEITITRPTPYFPQLLTHPATYPIHRPSLEQHGSRFALAGNIVSNGAYKLDSYVPGSEISLSRNTHFWDNANTAIDQVTYFPITDSKASLNSFRAGDIQIAFGVSPDSFQWVKENLPDELRVAEQLGLYYYGFNLTKPPFADNPKLRRALSMAIDRTTLVEQVTGRGEAPAFSWVPPGVAGYRAARLEFADLSDADRLKEARRLYAEAGYGPDNPVKFELRYHTSDVEQKIALAIRSMWRENLGAEATLVNEEFKVLLSNIRQMDITQLFRLSWIGDYNDPDTFLQLVMTGNPANMTGYSNPNVDRLLQAASRELSPEKRAAMMREAEAAMLADDPVIPLYFYVSKHLVATSVEGWEDNILDIHPSRYLSLHP